MVVQVKTHACAIVESSRNPPCLLEFHRTPLIVREQRAKLSSIHRALFTMCGKLGKFLPVAFSQSEQGYPCERNRVQGQ